MASFYYEKHYLTVVHFIHVTQIEFKHYGVEKPIDSTFHLCVFNLGLGRQKEQDSSNFVHSLSIFLIIVSPNFQNGLYFYLAFLALK